MSFKRMAGFSGIGFVVFQVVGFLFGGSPPDAEAPAAEIAKYVSDGGNTLKIGAMLTAVATIFIVPFIAGFLVPFLKSDRERGEGFGVTIFGGFLLTGAAAALGGAAVIPLYLRDGSELDAATTRALWDLSTGAYGLTILSVVIWAGAAAMAIMKHGLMPRWFGTFTGVVALTGFTGLAGILTGTTLGMLSFIGYLLVLVWALVTSIVMLREPVTA